MNNRSMSGARYKTAQSTAQALIIINFGFFLEIKSYIDQTDLKLAV